MITAVPLPSWRQLTALAGAKPNPDDVAAAWLRPGDQGLWHSRSSWSLAALAQAWHAGNGRPPRVWLPAYFCNATLGPLRGTGAELRFVPVDHNMVADWSLDSALPTPDLILLPHTFGQTADCAPALTLCRITGAALIEDCAHALCPAAGLGEHGEYVLWSPHKLLPVPHGGLLVRRPHARLPAHALTATGGAPCSRQWLIKRLMQKTMPGALLPPATRGGPQSFEADPMCASMPATPAASDAPLKMLAAMLDRIPQAGVRRQDLARALIDTLSVLPNWKPLFPELRCAPYRLVMRCATPDIARRRFNAFRAQGLPVESWPDMAPEVTANPGRFGAAMELRHTLLCFPVHQDLPTRELLGRCRRVED